MDNEIVQRLTSVEERERSNTHRIDDLERELKNNNALALNVKELTIEIKHMREDYQKLADKHTEEVKAIDNRLSQVENKPLKRYEQIITTIITRYSNCYTGFFISKIRNVRC